MYNTASSALEFPDVGNFTVSAWVHTDSIDRNIHYILSKGESRYHCAQFAGIPSTWHFDVYNNLRAMGEYLLGGEVGKKWTYVAGVRRGSATYLYVDGVCVDSTLTGETRPSDATKYDLVIGAMTEDFNGTFKGKIDEVRLSNVSCSMDWIRLCYMNQKIDDALVVFK